MRQTAVHGSTTSTPPDRLGRVMLQGQSVDMQEALDRAYSRLTQYHKNCDYLWDLKKVKQWGKQPASEKQIAQVSRMFPDYDVENMSKGDASQILNRMFGRRKKRAS